MKNGRVPRIQSAAAFTDPSAYVMPLVGPAGKHLLDAGWLFQNSDTILESVLGQEGCGVPRLGAHIGPWETLVCNLPGIHWNITKKK